MANLARGTRSQCFFCQKPVTWDIWNPTEVGMYAKPRWYHVEAVDPEAPRACFPGDDENGWKTADPVDYCTETLRTDDRYGQICNTRVLEEHREWGVCGRHSKQERERRQYTEQREFEEEVDQYVEESLDAVIDKWNTYYELDAHKEEAVYRRRSSRKWSGYIAVNPGRLNDLIAKIEEELI